MFTLDALRALFHRATHGRLTPGVKQIPTAFAFAVAFLVLFATRMPVSSLPQVIASAAIVLAGTLAAALLPWERIPYRWTLVVPCSTFIATALLRGATGGNVSAFNALLVIPVTWIAAEPGIGSAVIAGLGVCFTLVLPAYLDPAPATLRDIVRIFFSPFAFIVAAVIINEIARRLREAGEETVKAKDEFLGLVSHELRNPLTSVIGYLQLMRMDPSPLTDSQLEYIGIAERNAVRLQHLVGDLLLTAQVGGGSFPIELAPIDLDELVRQSVESARPAADQERVSLVAELTSGAIVDADADRLAQAVDNLLSNALKFTPADGRATVRTLRDEDCAIVSVTDTGIGIASEDLNRLSERFFRTSTATQAAIPGVGLGLTVTKAIAEAHGGSLEIESELGVGTTFRVRLPLAGG